MQPAPDRGLLGRPVPGVVGLGEQIADPAQRGRHRAAPRLGGVRGEHQVHAQPAEQAVEMARALIVAELAGRGGHRLAHRRDPGVTLPQRTDPLQLLGQVGEMEIHGERPGHQLGPVQRPAGHQRRDLVPAPVGARAGSVPAPGLDHRPAQPLGVVQEILAAGLAQHLAQDPAEQPYIAPHRRGQLLAVGIPGRRGGRRGSGMLAHRASLVRLYVTAVNPHW